MPLLPFIAGLAAGAAAVTALRSERARAALNATGTHLSSVRQAAQSGLDKFRRPAAEAPAAEVPAAAEPAVKPARTRKPAAPKAAAEPAAKRAPRAAKPSKAKSP